MRTSEFMNAVKRICVGIALLMLTTSCKDEEKSSANKEVGKDAISVSVATLVPTEYTASFEYLADIEGMEQAVLVAPSGGRVTKLLAIVGDFVKKGQKLCEIDSEPAFVALEAARLDTAIAFSSWQRKQQALEKNTVTKLSVDEAQALYLKAKQSQLRANQAYEGAFCLSPIDGVVVDRYIDLWQQIPPGAPTLVVADLQKQKVRAKFGIPEGEAYGFLNGSKVQLKEPKGQLVGISGTLSFIAKAVDPISRTYRAEAVIEDPGGSLTPGITVRLLLERAPLSNQIVVPNVAVLTEGKNQFVYVSHEGKAQKRLVRVHTSNAEQSVIASGLNLGEQIIVAGQLLVGDGAPIKLLAQ